jgi:hypothetical protein
MRKFQGLALGVPSATPWQTSSSVSLYFSPDLPDAERARVFAVVPRRQNSLLFPGNFPTFGDTRPMGRES